MQRILFVDDEANVLQGLQRMLRPMRHEWQMSFANSGAEALEKLAQEPFDVVISDMRMPGMNGAQLLTEVRKRYPHIVRIILSGQSDQEALLRAVGPSHQYLSKPCDADFLKTIITQVCTLRQSLSNDTLQNFMTQMEMLPSLPIVYAEMVDAMQTPDVTLQRLGEIVSHDIGMTAKVLQLVNSAYFGVPQRMTSAVQAINLIGLDTIKALVLSTHVFAAYDTSSVEHFCIETLNAHSWSVAAMAKQIAVQSGQESHIVNDSFTAGLLHDVGRLALVTNFSTEYDRLLDTARRESLHLEDVERDYFGVTHAEVGAYLMGLWGLPDPIVEAVAFHHKPSLIEGRRFSPLTAVHLANSWDHAGNPEHCTGLPSVPDAGYITDLGISEQLPAWRAACFNSQGK